MTSGCRIRLSPSPFSREKTHARHGMYLPVNMTEAAGHAGVTSGCNWQPSHLPEFDDPGARLGMVLVVPWVSVAVGLIIVVVARRGVRLLLLLLVAADMVMASAMSPGEVDVLVVAADG